MNQEQFGATGELSAKIEVLQIAIAALISPQTSAENAAFIRRFKDAVEQRESITRDPSSHTTWQERLGPHARDLLRLIAG